ncbi:MAG: methylated-DNA--[protein]-cysteine S-methyltransferase [Coriobacteriales bacterium]|jgi:methylated-DNA-[protein]-cysteine S-methyltransferase|nr:methylated-DNA--[protein]-cysteine S-methyltransferase [Coriobacteriales bacterium]
MYYTTEYESPVGVLTLASDGEHLAGLWLAGQKYHGASVPLPLHSDDGLSAFAEVRSWLDRYFAGLRPAPSEIALAPLGGEFRQSVWALLEEIPYGKTSTYGALAAGVAERMGKEKMSARAVGGAVGHNPISIIIPCHRVVGSGGSLTGYAGGIDRKIKLLTLEGVDMGRFRMPTKGTAL